MSEVKNPEKPVKMQHLGIEGYFVTEAWLKKFAVQSYSAGIGEGSPVLTEWVQVQVGKIKQMPKMGYWHF